MRSRTAALLLIAAAAPLCASACDSSAPAPASASSATPGKVESVVKTPDPPKKASGKLDLQ